MKPSTTSLVQTLWALVASFGAAWCFENGHLGYGIVCGIWAVLCAGAAMVARIEKP